MKTLKEVTRETEVDGLSTLILALIGLFVFALASLGFGADSRTYQTPSEMEYTR